jgi:hypothetical protein
VLTLVEDVLARYREQLQGVGYRFAEAPERVEEKVP